MKSYLSLIPISAKVHRRQNRMTLLCIVFAVFMVTAVFSMTEMGFRMEQARLVGKHGSFSIGDLLGSSMGQTLLSVAVVLFLLILIAGVLMISSSMNSSVAQRTKFFGMIIYIAALSGVDMEQHEAAVLDGATRFQRVIYLTLPAISGTIVTVFILNLAKVLNLFDPVWVLQNSMVINTSDVLETYVYRMGISGSQYGLSTAAGLFKSVISILLVAIGNKLSKKLTGEEVL